MFKTTSELLDFIEAAKEAKIKAFKIGEIEVQFSDLAFVDAFTGAVEPGTEERNTSKTLTDTAPDELDEDLLFWSAKD